MAELNLDCVRAIMLWLEKNQQIKSSGRVKCIKMKSVYPQLEEYRLEDLYSAATCIFESGLAKAMGGISGKTPRHYVCEGITPKGYDYLKAVHDDTVWKKIKGQVQTSSKKLIDEIIGFGVKVLIGKLDV